MIRIFLVKGLLYRHRLSGLRFREDFIGAGNSMERLVSQCYGSINDMLCRLKKEDGTGAAKTSNG